MRGSSEFHAWGDSNLYLRRDGEDLILTVEHRAASAMAPVTLELIEKDAALALEVTGPRSAPDITQPQSIDQRIISILAQAAKPMAAAEIHAQCKARTATLYARLGTLTTAGQITKTADGYSLVQQ